MKFDKFLDDVLIPVIASLVLIAFMANTSKAEDFGLYLAPEAEHMSHASQHEPLTDHPTHYGANMLGVALGFDYGKFNLELVESYNISPAYTVYGQSEYGEIMGGREQFSLRLRYKFTLIGK
jgi:hypothetical protein